jgi:hypothetical protein
VYAVSYGFLGFTAGLRMHRGESLYCLAPESCLRVVDHLDNQFAADLTSHLLWRATRLRVFQMQEKQRSIGVEEALPRCVYLRVH